MINEELGTQYSIPVEHCDEYELDEIKQLFTEMSIEEFRNYIYTAHYNCVSANSDNNADSIGLLNDSVASFSEEKLVSTQKLYEDSQIDSFSELSEETNSVPYSYTLVKQCYFYDPKTTGNYLFFQAENYTMNGYVRYNIYDSYSGGYIINSYPAYKATSCGIAFTSNDRMVTCEFSCVKMIAAGVEDTSDKPIKKCSFVAGAGDIYAV